MLILDTNATKEDIEMFLLYHMDNADDRKSIINPSLTKEQVWNIHMGVVMHGDITRTRELMVSHLTKEFGKHYEV